MIQKTRIHPDDSKISSPKNLELFGERNEILGHSFHLLLKTSSLIGLAEDDRGKEETMSWILGHLEFPVGLRRKLKIAFRYAGKISVQQNSASGSCARKAAILQVLRSGDVFK
ncbi:unnamed protein product [Larinioides sclopetarius]|uniref:Uncharacterized protein n=1 Tax=Larinioides sclopetarius TaxID=280406 RepID=A0AAV1ZEE9_9ARAC